MKVGYRLYYVPELGGAADLALEFNVRFLICRQNERRSERWCIAVLDLTGGYGKNGGGRHGNWIHDGNRSPGTSWLASVALSLVRTEGYLLSALSDPSFISNRSDFGGQPVPRVIICRLHNADFPYSNTQPFYDHLASTRGKKQRAVDGHDISAIGTKWNFLHQ